MAEFDLRGDDAGSAYKLLVSVVVPRPIAWVTSRNAQGAVNAAPFSFFNLMGASPPTLAINVADREPGSTKDTLGNIQARGEFVVNLVTEDLASAMNVCAIEFPPEVDELHEAGLTPIPSVCIDIPRIAESPVQMECRLHSVVTVGQNNIILAEIVYLHIADAYFDPLRGYVNTEKLHLIGRMHGRGWYARTSDLFDMPRIPVENWQRR
jgi:flavin reductase (DIM6/NTAB) family NADH-FMN oxidoreductase RutF